MPKILWIDDEIDVLRPLCIALEQKGYVVDTVSNASDALELIGGNDYDVILLDENMPGMSGLEALSAIKQIRSDLSIIMVTKSEEEDLMDRAYGSKIADYLVKPVRVAQLVSSIKKITERDSLINKASQENYQREYNNLMLEIGMCKTFADWSELYKKLVGWELELEKAKDMSKIQLMQKQEANNQFARFICTNYKRWLGDGGAQKPADAPLMSHRLMKERILSLLEQGEKVVMIVIDNCRYDQWETLRELLTPHFNIETELYCAILPTATQFARNAIFSGLLPSQIKQMFPDCWTDSDDESSQNQHEKQLIGHFFKRYRKTNFRYAYYKVNNAESGERLLKILPNYADNDLNAFVFNFVDMLSHARTDIRVVNELSNTDAAYRSITKTWFEHSALYELILRLKAQNVKIVITTDHGTIKVQNPQKVIGDRSVNSNLRFKTGKSLSYNEKEVFVVNSPEDIFLPKSNLTSSYIFALRDDFFVYPNNYSEYVDKFSATFQHGGVSMEEMIVPFAVLSPKI